MSIKKITNLKEQIRNEFEKINIYCDQFWVYQNINEDKSIFFRVYRLWKTFIW